MSLVDHPARFSVVLQMVSDHHTALIQPTLESLSRQVYTGYELCLIADKHAIDLASFESGDLPTSIYADLDDCLREAAGDFVLAISPGDQLAPGALAELAIYLDRFPTLDLVYSDEERVDTRGRRSRRQCKPDWSPDYLLSHNYIGRLAAYRKEKLLLAGGFTSGSDISDDYALALRFTHETQAIGHVPYALYCRRAGAPLPDPDEVRSTLENELQRRDWSASVEPTVTNPGVFCAHWKAAGEPRISIIICTQDRAEMVDACLQSIFEKSTYPDYEVILVDHASRQAETQALIRSWAEREPARFFSMRLDISFNFSRLNNQAVAHARGELLLFLNNDTRVVSTEWLEEMAGQAMRPQTGAVSALLIFPDQRVQHAGILVGGKDLAVHAYRGVPANSATLPNRLVAPSNFPALTGACLMVRKELFQSQGGFNEDLAVSYGDVDFCLRLKQAGYNNVLLPFVQLIHYESASRGYEVTREKKERLQSEARILKRLWPELQDDHFSMTA